jgi:hypothetical protein
LQSNNAFGCIKTLPYTRRQGKRVPQELHAFTPAASANCNAQVTQRYAANGDMLVSALRHIRMALAQKMLMGLQTMHCY